MPDVVFDEDKFAWANSAAIANAPAGGVGAAAGAYDTAANRDLMIAAINNILTALRNAGIIATD